MNCVLGSVITFNICHGNMMSDNRKNNLKIIHRRIFGGGSMATIKNVYIATYTLFQWPNSWMQLSKFYTSIMAGKRMKLKRKLLKEK